MEKATGETRPDVAIAARIERDDFGLDVDITANAGDVIGVTGDIGSGKSSVLLLVAGRLRAASGAVIVDGEAWDDPAASIVRAERPACLLSQTFHNDLPEELTGVEAVCGAIGRISPDLDAPAAESLARATLAGLGVEEHVVDRLPWTFSGAEAQRVALARAIAPSPRLLLLDEPFGALDKRTGQTVRTWLAEWLADYDGVALIASTNDADLTVLCDWIIHLE